MLYQKITALCLSVTEMHVLLCQSYNHRVCFANPDDHLQRGCHPRHLERYITGHATPQLGTGRRILVEYIKSSEKARSKSLRSDPISSCVGYFAERTFTQEAGRLPATHCHQSDTNASEECLTIPL